MVIDRGRDDEARTCERRLLRRAGLGIDQEMIEAQRRRRRAGRAANHQRK